MPVGTFKTAEQRSKSSEDVLWHFCMFHAGFRFGIQLFGAGSFCRGAALRLSIHREVMQILLVLCSKKNFQGNAMPE